MNSRLTLLLTLTSALCFHFAWAQEPVTAKDTICDKNIVFPSSFDLDTRNIHDNWYLQRYAVLDSMARKATKAKPTDELYIKRLQALPTVIEMPFNSIVKSYIEMYAFRKPELVEKILGMSLYYMPMFEDALEKYNLPNELKYLPVIESALNPNAISKAGACGLWQFMASTATGQGLEVNALVDQRRDPLASSDAAARYLQTLYNMYNDWPLAIAAYNCGPGTINKAIKKANDKKDYWDIYYYLPEETRGYVPAFIAANYIMTYYAEHGISHALARRPLTTDTVHVKQRVHFQQIADVLGVPIDELRVLNPQYRSDIIPGNIRPYALTLPTLQASCYSINEDTIVNYQRDKFLPRTSVEPSMISEQDIKSDEQGQYVEEAHVIYHKVKKGQTIKSIANQYGVSVESIRRANNLASNKVKTGKTLKIKTTTRTYITKAKNQDQAATINPDSIKPTSSESSLGKPSNENAPARTSPQPATPKDNYTTYTVKAGDSLGKIATAHGITLDKLMKINNLKSTTIKVGQKLKVPAGKAKSKTSTSSSKKTTKKSSKKK